MTAINNVDTLTRPCVHRWGAPLAARALSWKYSVAFGLRRRLKRAARRETVPCMGQQRNRVPSGIYSSTPNALFLAVPVDGNRCRTVCSVLLSFYELLTVNERRMNFRAW